METERGSDEAKEEMRKRLKAQDIGHRGGKRKNLSGSEGHACRQAGSEVLTEFLKVR